MKKNKNKDLMAKVLSLISSTQNEQNVISQTKQISFAAILENFVHFDFTEDEAEKHWKNIIEKYEALQQKLGNEANLHLAIVDYFTNSSQIISQPMLIEVHVFKQTEQLAMLDGLTGIFNRRYMDIILKKEANRCLRYDKKLSICILDIDNFKHFNDTYGHQFGDTVLISLADKLQSALREEDIACRYGGEEFMLILPETDSSGAFILIERIRNNLKKIPLFNEKKITFSCGIATLPTASTEIEELIRASDKALYEAKFTGKNKTIIAPPERRKFDRFPQSWKLDIYKDNSFDLISGITTKNVSLGGIQFECNVLYPIDTQLFLRFTNPNDNDKIIEARSKITWVKRINENLCTYGVSFINLPDILKTAFSNF